MEHMDPYLQSFLPFAQKRLGFNKPPSIFFDSDAENSKKVLGKTGYYDPDASEIVIFVDNRHPKDILRSLSHELVHHAQNCRGDLNPEVAGETGLGYAQNNAHMRGMESEAYEKGNLCMRDWEDSVKLQISLKLQLQETNYVHTKGENHKMAAYDELKERITKSVVQQLLEKVTNKVEEEAKPDFLDLDGDGDKEEPMKKAAKEKKSVKEASYDPDSSESGGYSDRDMFGDGDAREKFVKAMAEQMQKKLVNMEDDGTYVKATFEGGTKGYVGMAAGADGVEAYLYDPMRMNISDPAEAAAKLDAELKERKKRDEPRNDRGIPQRLKEDEEEEEPLEELFSPEDWAETYAMADQRRDTSKAPEKDPEEEEEIEERKKRDTPRDSDRLEPQKLKVSEAEALPTSLYARNPEREKAKKEKEEKEAAELKRAKAAGGKARKRSRDRGERRDVGIGGLTAEEKNHTLDEWYQNELYQKLINRWTK